MDASVTDICVQRSRRLVMTFLATRVVTRLGLGTVFPVAFFVAVMYYPCSTPAAFQYFITDLPDPRGEASSAKRTSDGLELFQTIWRGEDRYVGLSMRAKVLDPFPPPKTVTEIGTYYRSIDPVCSGDGLIMIFGSERPSPPLYAANSMWISTRPNRSSAFSSPVLISDFDYYSAVPQDLSPDGLSLWYRHWDSYDNITRHTTRPAADKPFGPPEVVHPPNLNHLTNPSMK